MRGLMKKAGLFADPWPYLLYEHNDDKILAFQRNRLLFVFNFHPTLSQTDYRVPAPAAGKYRVVLDTDSAAYGGHDRLIPDQVHFTLPETSERNGSTALSLYLPTRTAVVLYPEN